MMKHLCLLLLAFLPLSAIAQDSGDNIDSGMAGVQRMVNHLKTHGVKIAKDGNLHILLYRDKQPPVVLDGKTTQEDLVKYDSFDWSYSLNPMETETDLGSELAGFSNSHPQGKKHPIAELGQFLHDLHEAIAG
jgi:hypothetical protein